MDRTALITDNLMLVHKFANKYKRLVKDNAVDYDDIFSEGCIGLIKAAKTFDPSKGFQFSTYASRTIWGTILRAFGRKGFVSVPQHIIEVTRGIFREGMSDSTAEEISECLGCPLKWSKWALHYIGLRSISMDIQVRGGEGDPLDNFVPYDEDFTVAVVGDFISTLKPIHREVVELVLSGKDYRTIGDMLGITFQGVSNRMQKVKRFYAQYQLAAAAE